MISRDSPSAAFVYPPAGFWGAAAASPGRWCAGIRSDVIRSVTASLAVLVPCFWHRHLVAGDLGSHVYNAWLAELVRDGHAPGLTIVPQAGNVLFDWLLETFARFGGLDFAERTTVALTVLVFFWGAMRLVWSMAGRRSWLVAPLIAMVAYGWTFHSGFFNYYLSVGLSFWALAAWMTPGWRRWLGPAMLPLVYAAHPLGLAWAIGAMAYVIIARRLRPVGQMGLLAAALIVITLARVYLLSHYEVVREIYPVTRINGADQVVLGTAYNLVGLGFAGGAALVLLGDGWARRAERRFWFRHGLALQLYAVTLGAIWLLPTSVQLPNYSGPLAYVLERFSLISAVLLGCVLGPIRVRRWQFGVVGVLAAAYFGLLFRDTAGLDRIATRLDGLIDTLPTGTRVVMARMRTPGSRLLFNHHLLDRACAGRCFAYANYEPATRQFRLRAQPGNGIVLASTAEVDAVQAGTFSPRPGDLPLYEVVRQGRDPADLTLRPLGVGERMRGITASPGTTPGDMESRTGVGGAAVAPRGGELRD